MDPLSGAASVTAVVAVAFQSIQVIHDVISGIRNGPDQIRRLVISVEDLRGILDQLQNYNDGDSGLILAIKNCGEDLEVFKIKLRKLKTPGTTKVLIAWRGSSCSSRRRSSMTCRQYYRGIAPVSL